MIKLRGTNFADQTIQRGKIATSAYGVAGQTDLVTYTSIDDLPGAGNSPGDLAFVSGSTNKLYIWNGSSWYFIATVNNPPSITSIQDSDGNTSPFSLSTDGIPTKITITATDSEGGLFTFSAEPDSDFAGLATILQDSSEFTITPLSEDSATTDAASVTFKVSDGVNITSLVNQFKLLFAKIEYLVIAGGGGGASGGGGGGGAGGYRSSVCNEVSGACCPAESQISVTGGCTYTITVGAGGDGGSGVNQPGGNGNCSTFDTIVSIGGGGGGSADQSGCNGGSGGGGSRSRGGGEAGGSATACQGCPGGATTFTGSSAAGGGGAGATGCSPVNNVCAGHGGRGLISCITGPNVYRAGGGGGSGTTFFGEGYTTGGSGGLGGGACGAGNGNGCNASANFGGGGGAGSYVSGSQSGGCGGSGVVIIRTSATAVSTTGSPSCSTCGLFNIYCYTGSGSITF